LGELKRILSIDEDDNKDDLRLVNVINGASRAVDRWCRRTFYETGSVASPATRYYTALRPCTVLTADVVSIATVATDDGGTRGYGTTWATTDYDTLPDNAAAEGVPISQLDTAPNGRYRFPHYPKGVRITGIFGVASTSPWLEIVREATALQAQRLFKRKDAPFGVAGFGTFGQLTLVELDPDVKALLMPPIKRLRN
jgi:hypothetical protein